MDSSHTVGPATHPSRGSAVQAAALAGLTLLLSAVPASAANAPASATPEDLRPVYATPADIREGREAASSLCAACHGANGLSTGGGVPHVAGQRPSYLYAKAKAYQAGTIPSATMAAALRHVRDASLVKVAAYYASLDPAGPAAVAGKPAPAKDPLAAGRAAAEACTGCHGDAGVSDLPGTPHLAGLDPKYFVAAMNAYRNGPRKHAMMAPFAQAAGEADVKNMALFYALQKPAVPKTAAAGNAVAGKAASAACAGCHGEQGVSTNPAHPGLAGQDAQYLVDAMRAYQDGSRADETMKKAAAGLDAATLADLAAYYAAQTARPPKIVKPLALADWVQRCDRCHGVNGNSTDPRTPAIASQRIDYLEKALHAYRHGERRNSTMAAMAGALSEDDVGALAHHYAARKARTFVFVPVPAR